MIHAMSPLGAPPADPSNAHADDPAAATLGRALFGDVHLSPSGRFACSSCHDPNMQFMDGLATGVGVDHLDRNTPSITLAAWSRWQFWDGRADTLWAQALGPIENAREMASTRLFVAHYVATSYASQYAAVFGSTPDLSDATRFPPSGTPLDHDAAWSSMTAADQSTINGMFANVGKAIEAYERTLRLASTPLDAYVAGNLDAMTPNARDSLRAFMSADGCIQCHYGPRLTDDAFHNIGMPTGQQDGLPDLGRINGLESLLANPFRANGPFSDAPANPGRYAGFVPDATMIGAFRTPPLRGTALTGPWGHGGTFTALHDVMYHYATRATMPPATTSAGVEDWHLNGFHHDDGTLNGLVELMQAMSPPM
jgi:cytochrome c peroxidase